MTTQQAIHQLNGRAIFFDLDGTLLDSLPDLTRAVDQMMLSMGHPAPGPEKVGRWIGNGAERLIKRALTQSMTDEPPAAQFEQGRAHFKHYYTQNLAAKSRLYPGVSETLAHLYARNIPLVCITNKPAAFTGPLLERFDLARYFRFWLAGDTLTRKKPHPEPLLYAANRCHSAIHDCIMVGDSTADVAAAHAAGCRVIAVSYGYNHGVDIRLSQPDRVIGQFSQLLHMLD